MAFQQSYRIAFFFLKLSRRIFRINTQGAQVILWVNGKLLLVRSSYRNEFTFPGGYINAKESAAQAACRELFEEANINVSESSMQLKKKIEYYEHGRQLVDYIFSCNMSSYPPVSIDNREIVEAVFVTPVESLLLPLHYSAREMIDNEL